jgi:uncharacterized RDD family membrane protein YckC
MKTCTRCGLANPDSSGQCDCGGSLAGGDQPAMAPGRVAGFWIRVFSDLLDALFLGVIGFALALALPGLLHSLGERAVLIGAAISLVYSGVLQSQIGGGRTLAKRLLGLRVLRLDGSYLSLDRSLVRWSTLGVLGYGTAVAYALSSVVPFFALPTLLAAFGGAQLALSLGCVLLVPFHPLKRGLHDLLTGSIVIRGDRFPAELVERLTRPARDRRLTIAGVAVALLGTGIGLGFASHTPAAVQPGLKVMTEMAAIGIQNPGVVEVRSLGPSAVTTIVATGYLPTSADGTPQVENAEERVLASIRKEMPLNGVDRLVVTLRQGINLGIYSSYLMGNRVEPVAAENAQR